MGSPASTQRYRAHGVAPQAPLRGGCSLALPTPRWPSRSGTFTAVSTRGLILAALLCGLAILAAFALQVSLLK